VARILYVEDNEDNLYMLTLRFDVLGGYEILSAATGAEGIAKAAAEPNSRELWDALNRGARHHASRLVRNRPEDSAESGLPVESKAGRQQEANQYASQRSPILHDGGIYAQYRVYSPTCGPCMAFRIPPVGHQT